VEMLAWAKAAHCRPLRTISSTHVPRHGNNGRSSRRTLADGRLSLVDAGISKTGGECGGAVQHRVGRGGGVDGWIWIWVLIWIWIWYGYGYGY